MPELARRGKLVALRTTGRETYRGFPIVVCRCDCGSPDKEISWAMFQKSSSCGCLRLTHEHRAWVLAKQRCSNPRTAGYADYGGRGIRMSAEWLNNFDAFLKDMGYAPEGTSLDRIDNDLGYQAGNCQWSSPKEQARNRRNNKLSDELAKEIRANNGSFQYELAAEFNVNQSTICRVIGNKRWAEV